jgi:hypothetical protein
MAILTLLAAAVHLSTQNQAATNFLGLALGPKLARSPYRPNSSMAMGPQFRDKTVPNTVQNRD